MLFKNISDCHTHSNVSYDGDCSMFDMCQTALELNLHYYAITDHCECERFNEDEHPYAPVVKKAILQMEEMEKEFSGKLNIIKGVELGQPVYALDVATSVLKNYDYDFVIGSVHALNDGTVDFYFWDENNKDVEPTIQKYFDELHRLIDFGDFNTLAHITYPLRYIVGKCKLRVDMALFLENSKKIFKRLIENNIALELNTSPLRSYPEVFDIDIMLFKTYYEMGGRLLTVGSDAHNTKDLGTGIQKAYEELYKIGFKQYTVFKNRKAIMIDFIKEN